MAVIGYHLGYDWIPGGFVGVDLFFVLSGYLITSLLVHEHARSGHISFRAFWYRRAKRLLPALFLMLAVVSVWIGATAPTFEMPARRDDLIATLLYVANWHFIASGQDYFAQFFSASPLLHTWSLAIEEQFYLLWPLLIASAIWLGRSSSKAIAAMCLIGMVISVGAMALLYDPGDPTRAYFGTDTRAHQLLAGALLAVLMLRPQASAWAARIRHSAPLVAIGAVVLIVMTFALLSDQEPAYYRGLSVVLAGIAAALIWAVEVAPQSLPARILSVRPLAWIGLVSYGLYLWHWPMILGITSAPSLLGLPAGVSGDLVRVVATFGAAIASFYLLELPIRRARLPYVGSSMRRYASAIVLSGLLVGGTAFWQTSTASPEVTAIEELPGCATRAEVCLRRQGAEGAPVVALIGDSIARSLDPAFLQLAEGHGWTYVLATSDGCRLTHLLTSHSVLGVRPKDQRCYDETPRQLEKLIDTWHPTAIVAIDRWEITDFVGPEGTVVTNGTALHRDLTEAALVDVARELTDSGAELAFIELPPAIGRDCVKESNANAPTCLRNVSEDGDDRTVNEAVNRVASTVPGVAVISLTHLVCPDGVCVPRIDGSLVRFDGLHFTAQAARRLAPEIYSQLVHAGAITP